MAVEIKRNGAALAKYVFVGGGAALVEWSTYWLMLQFSPLHYLLSAVIAFVLATFANYLLGMRVMFVSKTGSAPKDIAMVYVASLLGLGLNLLTLGVLVERAGVHPMAAKIVGTGTAFLFNFACRQFLIFHERASPRSSGF